MTKTILTAGSILLGLTSLTAQETVSGGGDAPAPVVSGSLGIDFTTAYFFRGILQENQGVIGQPWVELGYNLYTANEGLKNLDLTFGLWNSLHDGPTGGAGGPWYESDFYVGLSAGIGDRLSVGATYTSYYSPNATFGTVQEIAFSASVDDSGWFGESLQLNPSLTVAFELNGQADAGAKRGTYAEIGIEPSFAIGKLGDADLTLTVPVKVGLSLGDYYEYGTGDDDFLGYFDIGAAVSAPLHFMPARLGPWDASLGLHAIVLGDNNKLVNHDDGTALVLSLGLSTTF